MDFLDPKKKRAHNIRLFVGYFLMGITLLLVTLILFFEASGFDIDRKTGAVIQNGLVFVDAHPEPATIYVNGDQKGQTDNRLVLPAGQYDIELQREGYRTWKHSFNLVGSTIERLVYAFMFPTNLNPADLRVFEGQPGVALQSPDRRWLLVQQPGSINTFTMTDLNDEDNPSAILTVPPTILAPGPGSNQLELVEWSTDNRHVVVKHAYEGGQEYILIDREAPEQSANLTKHFSAAPFTTIKLRDKKFDQYYLHNAADGLLRTADFRSATTTPILNNVREFQPHGDDELLYATTEGAPEGKVFIRARTGTETYTLREQAAAEKYLLDLARFDNEWYMAIGATNDPRIYIYKEAFEDFQRDKTVAVKPYSTLRLGSNAQYLSFSANTRFVGAQSGSNFAVFDADTDRSFRYDLKLPLAPGQKATWMDGHRYVLVSEGQLYAFDFNGTNIQQLLGVQPQYLPYFDRDYDYLYTISPSITDSVKPALVKTPMRTAADL